MFISQHFPNSNTSGNLTYLDALVSFLEGEDVDFRLVVLGERFPNNEIFFRYPEAPHRLRSVIFPRGRRIGNCLVLKELRPFLQNLVRRAVLVLPSGATKNIREWYFRRKKVSTEHYFQHINPSDLSNALQQAAEFRPQHLFLDSIKLSEIAASFHSKECQTHLIMHDLLCARLASLSKILESRNEQDALNYASPDELKNIEKKEFERIRLFDHILAIQKQEAIYVTKKLPHKSVLYVPMPAVFRKNTRGATPLSKRCLFVGSQMIASVQGIAWFIKEVWPKVLKEIPEAVLDICGTCCTYLEKSTSSVRLHGRVPDLQMFYDQADVCVVPLLSGSGMKIKLVDALAQGSACVTTAIGMQGLEEGADSAFIYADKAEAFAEAVVLLMTDQTKRDRFRLAAVAYADKHLAPTAVFAELSNIIHSIPTVKPSAISS